MERTQIMVVAQPQELVVFDPDARLERACEVIVDAGQAGADWVIFPEAYLPGAPLWLWSGFPDDAPIGALQTMTLAHAVVIPGVVSDRLCRLAQRSQVGVVIGLIERANDTCSSSLLVIDAHGCICGHYRSMLSAAIWSSVAVTTSVQMEQMQAQPEWTGGI